VVIWYIFPILVCLDQEKSGNPGSCIRQRFHISIVFAHPKNAVINPPRPKLQQILFTRTQLAMAQIKRG
jgi:hypothetical protein